MICATGRSRRRFALVCAAAVVAALVVAVLAGVADGGLVALGSAVAVACVASWALERADR